MNRKLSILLILALALLSFSMTVNAQDAILVWNTGSEDEALVLQAAADAYAAAGGPAVTVEAVSWDDAHARMLAASTSGTGPDIITGGLSWGIEFGSLGGMIDLNAAYPEEVAAIAEQANVGTWAAIVPPTGEIYAVPFDLTLYMFYYNSEVLGNLGVEVPTTWEELTAAIEVVREANGGEGGYAMDWGNAGWLAYQNYLYEAGGTWYDAECTAATVNSEEGVVALEFFASLYTDYGVPGDAAPDVSAGLNSGLYPLAGQGSWIAGGLERTYPEIAGKWGVTIMPAGPAGSNSSFIGGRVIGVMSYSQQADAAWDFIQYLWTPEATDAIVTSAAERGIFWIPPTAEFVGSSLVSDEVNAAVQAQLDQAVGPPNCAGWEQATNEVTRQIQSVIFEGADAQEALDIAADAMDELLQ